MDSGTTDVYFPVNVFKRIKVAFEDHFKVSTSLPRAHVDSTFITDVYISVAACVPTDWCGFDNSIPHTQLYVW